MKKQQIILVLAAVVITGVLYFFVPNVKPVNKVAAAGPGLHEHNDSIFDINDYLSHAVGSLSPARQQYINELSALVKRGDVKEQAIHESHQLARFWKDSVPDPPLYFYYQSNAAQLENSEKTLTFAAQSILGYIPYAQNQPLQSWLANKGKELFDKALVLNPANDSSIVGSGACIMFGADPGEGGPMSGILKVRGVVEKDSNNMFAQYMLGLGGLQSKQYDKALKRFEKVAQQEPDNVEVLFKLAETNELMGNKDKAADFYQLILKRVEVPDMKVEIQKRIDELRKK